MNVKARKNQDEDKIFKSALKKKKYCLDLILIRDLSNSA